MIKNWVDRNLKGDPVIWAIVILLSIVSILVVYSATGTLAYKNMGGNTEHYLIRHGFLVILSLAFMWGAHQIDYRYYAKISRFALYISVPLLLFSWLFGTTLNEASRWITIPVINKTFQPSDLAKLALIAQMASLLARRQQTIDDFKESIVPILLWCGLICGLIAMTNLSTALLLLVTCGIMLFIGRVPVKYLAMLALVGILAGAIAFSIGQRRETAVSRIKDYLDRSEIPFQAKQSYIAIATGGMLGKGPGNSVRRNFLPHSYSDFIFAIIVEEYGVVGAVGVIILYLGLLYRGLVTATKSERAFGGLLSAGLSLALVMQAMVNIGVAVGLLPITGLPLPLVSMGGTSLIFTGISLGIILSVSRGETEEYGMKKANDLRKVAKAA
ncbi:MAG: FtsW/RodA/SpoVE family cell cycle protein [Cyclobacteriaceae bacterium]|nr:FtsW/RodA/SpoVE family cell cycle protein [Cyclobacteriaceae bacterium]